MSVSYFVRYEGTAQDRAAFVDYYRRSHVPILARWPRIRQIILHQPIAWQDPFPVHPDRFCLLAQMVFDSEADLQTALGSPERAEAREDFARFPAFRGSVLHQAVESEQCNVEGERDRQ